MKHSPTQSYRPIRELLQQAAQWRLTALLFSCPQGDWQVQLAMLAAEVSDDQLQAAARAAAEQASEGLYHTTFGPGGPAAPREVSYRESDLSGRFLAELCDFYAAFAYLPSFGEPPDHMAVETDFLGYLRLKEAYALSRGEVEQAAVTAEAAARFLDDHLSVMAEPLATSLAHSEISYLALTSQSLLQRVGPPRHQRLSDAAAWVVEHALPVCQDDLSESDEDV